MKKNFGKKTILATLPVLIVATYDENGIPDAMNVAWGGQCSAHHVALNLAIGQYRMHSFGECFLLFFSFGSYSLLSYESEF